MFKPTYLYIKTHNITGLKYFGKTVGDPYKYKGSGVRWLNHLTVHGNDVFTEVIGLFESKEECNKRALEFSIENNIVEDPGWANLIIEDGLMGGFTKDQGEKIRQLWNNLSEEQKQERRKKSNPWLNKTEEELAQYKDNLKKSMMDMYQSDFGKELLDHKREVGKSLLVNGKRLLSDDARAKMRESAIRTNQIRKEKKLLG